MANGDIAAGVGYDVTSGADDIRQGYDEINKTRDYLAQHRISGTHDWTAINGLQNQLDLKLDANHISFGFRDVQFNDGLGAVFHNQPWTPEYVVVSARRDSSPIMIATSSAGPSADSVGLRAWFAPSGDPYNGVVTIDFFIARSD